jgi:hypothetical protein
LTAQQQADIAPIVTRAHVALLELRFAHQAEVEQILSRGMAELSAKLSPDQKIGLERMYKGLERRWRVSREYLETEKRKLTSP